MSEMSKRPVITGSIVAYRTEQTMLAKAVESFLSSAATSQLYLIDNSPTDDLRSFAETKAVVYIHVPENVGYGAGHNRALQRAIECDSDYHVMMNPDITYQPAIISNLLQFVERNSSCGVVMPRVESPLGELQHLCKQDPKPLDLIVRRFVPSVLRSVFARRLAAYELGGLSQAEPTAVPVVSGCFMFCRVSALRDVKGFDERFFLYLEDYDLCRMVRSLGYKVFYYPNARLEHAHGRASYRSLRPLAFHISSATKYFNKWGWFPAW